MLTKSLIFSFKNLFSKSPNSHNSHNSLKTGYLWYMKKCFFYETEFTWRSFRAFTILDSRKIFFSYFIIYFKGIQYMNQNNSKQNKNMKYPNSQKGPFRGSVYYGWGKKQQSIGAHLLFLSSFLQRLAM